MRSSNPAYWRRGQRRRQIRKLLGRLSIVPTAFFGLTLKGDTGMARYLDLASGPWTEPAGDRDWAGFGPRTTRGLVVEHLPASR